MVLHLPTGPLYTSCGFEPVLRCEPSTYQPLTYNLATAPMGPVLKIVIISIFINFKHNTLSTTLSFIYIIRLD